MYSLFNTLNFKAMGPSTCHRAGDTMNLRKHHSLKKKIPWETAIRLTLHQVKSNVEIASSKSLTGDNLGWQWDGKCEVSRWFLLQTISRVGLFLGVDAKHTIPKLQRGKCVSRETVPCIMGDVAIT